MLNNGITKHRCALSKKDVESITKAKMKDIKENSRLEFLNESKIIKVKKSDTDLLVYGL